MPVLRLHRSKTAAALLKMLSPPARNLNPKFLSPVSTIADKTLIPNPSHFSNPWPLHPISAQHLPASTPKSINGVRGVSTRSTAIDISSGSQRREVEGEMEGLDSTLVVVSFYRFADFPDHAAMRKTLKDLCEQVVA